MQNGDKASPSIILVGLALLVKRLIALEPHGIFSSNFCLLIQFYIVLTLVYKTKTRFHRASVWPVMVS